MDEVVVEEGNPYFSSKDGLLYNYDGSELLLVPGNREGILTLSDQVTSIAPHALYGCKKITGIQLSKTHPTLSSEGGVLYNKNQTKLLWVSRLSKGNVVVKDSVKEIGVYAFAGCDQLKHIRLPQGLQAILRNAFIYCNGLQRM